MTRARTPDRGPPACPPEGSPVGALCRALPSFARLPPVEAVVFAWGASEDHQLGLDTVANCNSPKVVEALLGLQLMGRGFPGTPLIAGSRNTLAIDAEGQLWSWGWNDRGTLGHGHRGAERKPRRVQGLKGVRILQAAIGGWHCLALSDQGQVYAWGGNEYNQCGLQDPSRDILTPQPCVPQLRVRQVACGGMNSLVLADDGSVWTWGEPWGDFSLEVSREPRKVEGARDIAAIACGAFHSMALSSGGEVFCWGTNDYGQLGNGSTCYSTVPEKVVDLDGIPIADVAAGGWHSLALTSDGQIYVWGRGEYGRLGVGDRTGSSKLRPHPVRGLEGFTVVQVAAGGTHSMALTSNGRTFIWGRASYGRLGLGEGARDHYSPVEAALPGGHERWRVAAVTCGGRHTMCLAVPLRETPGAAEDEEAAYAAALQQRGRSGGPQVQFDDGGAGAAAAANGAAPPRPPSAAGGAPSSAQRPPSPLRRPLSSAGGEAGAGAGAGPALSLSLSRAGSRSLDISNAPAATLAQVRILSPGRPAGAAAAAPPTPGSATRAAAGFGSFTVAGGGGTGAAGAGGSGSGSGSGAFSGPPPRSPPPLAALALPAAAAGAAGLAAASAGGAPPSPGGRGGRLFALSSALSEVPAEDAAPLSGDDSSEEDGEAELDRRHGTGAGGASPGGSVTGRPSDAGLALGRGGGDDAFGRAESMASMHSVSSLGSPVAGGPGGTYSVGAERSSIHHLTHLS